MLLVKVKWYLELLWNEGSQTQKKIKLFQGSLLILGINI